MTTAILLLLLPVYIILFWLIKITLEGQQKPFESQFLNVGDSLPEIIIKDEYGKNINLNELNELVLFFVKKTCSSCKQVLSNIDKEEALFLNKKVFIVSSESIDREQVKFHAHYITNKKISNYVRVVPSAILVKNGKVMKSTIVKDGNDLVSLLHIDSKSVS